MKIKLTILKIQSGYMKQVLNLLKVYNSTNAIWVATNVISPILVSATDIQNGQAENITLTGSNFGTSQGVMSFTPSGGSASTISATPSNDTEVTGALASAIYNFQHQLCFIFDTRAVFCYVVLAEGALVGANLLLCGLDHLGLTPITGPLQRDSPRQF